MIRITPKPLSARRQHRQQCFHESRGFHETRLFRPFPLTSRQTFLLQRPRSPTMLFTNHETRITAFYFSAAFASCGAAMARHGRPPSPAPALSLYGFHETRLFRSFPFTGRQAFLLERTRPPTKLFTNHARNESQLFPAPRRLPGFPGISHHFPAPPEPLRRSRSASPRAPSAAAPASDRQARKRIAART